MTRPPRSDGARVPPTPAPEEEAFSGCGRGRAGPDHGFPQHSDACPSGPRPSPHQNHHSLQRPHGATEDGRAEETGQREAIPRPRRAHTAYARQDGPPPPARSGADWALLASEEGPEGRNSALTCPPHLSCTPTPRLMPQRQRSGAEQRAHLPTGLARNGRPEAQLAPWNLGRDRRTEVTGAARQESGLGRRCLPQSPPRAPGPPLRSAVPLPRQRLGRGDGNSRHLGSPVAGPTSTKREAPSTEGWRDGTNGPPGSQALRPRGQQGQGAPGVAAPPDQPGFPRARSGCRLCAPSAPSQPHRVGCC